MFMLDLITIATDWAGWFDLLLKVLGLAASVAIIAGGVWYYFSDSRSKKKLSAAKEWRELAEAHAARVAELVAAVETWKQAHQQCEQKINEITTFNLRLQARERQYQRTINRLELRSGLEVTDWNDITDVPSINS